MVTSEHEVMRREKEGREGGTSSSRASSLYSPSLGPVVGRLQSLVCSGSLRNLPGCRVRSAEGCLEGFEQESVERKSSKRRASLDTDSRGRNMQAGRSSRTAQLRQRRSRAGKEREREAVDPLTRSRSQDSAVSILR